jgi:uncharacterized membrane protein
MVDEAPVHGSSHSRRQRASRWLRELLHRRDGAQQWWRLVLRVALAAFLALAGVGHFTNTEEFLAQVPPYLPAPTLLVLISGVVELVLAGALLLLPRRRALVGLAVLLLFIAVLPGNIAQYTEGRDAFGLDTDTARLVRVLLSPLLWLWALVATDLWPPPKGRLNR